MMNRNFVKKAMVLAFAGVLAAAPAAFAETEPQTDIRVIGGADGPTSILVGGWDVNVGTVSIDALDDGSAIRTYLPHGGYCALWCSQSGSGKRICAGYRQDPHICAKKEIR